MGYKISVVRFKDEQYEELIDKLLIYTYDKDGYSEAVDDLEKLMINSHSFTDDVIRHAMKWLRRKNAVVHFCTHGVYTKNLHNQLGPGGYFMEKVEDEEEPE